MVEISPLTAPDRVEWEALARSYHADSSNAPDNYDVAWGRLLEGDQVRGAVARLDGRMIGFAHYYFHTSVWEAGDCRGYLQDLYVAEEARRRGVARALVDWVSQTAREHGATRLHWHTTEDNAEARALYDSLTTYKGFIAYARALVP